MSIVGTQSTGRVARPRADGGVRRVGRGVRGAGAVSAAGSVRGAHADTAAGGAGPRLRRL